MTLLITIGILLAGISWICVFEPHLITNHLYHIFFDVEDEIPPDEEDNIEC